jgi:Flp pilus assembly pilin Flp
MISSNLKSSIFPSKIKQFGQGMTEYIIIVALIAVAAIGAFGFFGDTIENQVAGLAAEISGGSGQAGIDAAQGSAGDAETAASTHKNLGNYNMNSQAGVSQD